jgi:ketosteroid isomerase-like protein
MKKPALTLASLLFVFCTSGALLQLRAQASAAADDKKQIEDLEQRFATAFGAKDINTIMSGYAPGKALFVFDVTPPRQYVGWDAYKRDWESFFAQFQGPASLTLSELSVTVVGTVAYSHSIQTGHLTAKDGTRTTLAVRTTDVYRKIGGKWLIVEEHNSVPVDLATGQPDLLSKP